MYTVTQVIQNSNDPDAEPVPVMYYHGDDLAKATAAAATAATHDNDQQFYKVLSVTLRFDSNL